MKYEIIPNNYEKTCTTCKTTKLATEFAIYKNKCKLCLKLFNQQYYQNNLKIKHPKSVGRPCKTINQDTHDIPLN